MDSESRSQNQSHVVKKRELSVVLSGSCVIIVALPGNQPEKILRGDGDSDSEKLELDTLETEGKKGAMEGVRMYVA